MSVRARRRQIPRRQVWRRIFLKEWLALTGKTQTELAAHTGDSETIVSLIANGHRRYNQEFLEGAAGYLGLDPADLLFPPPEASVWAAWGGLDAEDRRTMREVLFAIRNKARR